MPGDKIKIEKLHGRENYNIWKIQAKSYLIISGYKSYIEAVPATSATAAELEKDQKALCEIFLLVDEHILSHIKDCTNAHTAWTALQKTFADSGLGRKVY